MLSKPNILWAIPCLLLLISWLIEFYTHVRQPTLIEKSYFLWLLPQINCPTNIGNKVIPLQIA